MHYGKKHLKEVAKEYLEPTSEGDHKPAKSEFVKADLINATNKALNQKTRNRKAVKDLDKVLSDIKGIPRKSALNMLGMGVSRCWKDYKPNPDGRPASEDGSCVKR
jgi:hypothetical protein